MAMGLIFVVIVLVVLLGLVGFVIGGYNKLVTLAQPLQKRLCAD